MKRPGYGERIAGRYARGGAGLKLLVFLVLVVPSGALAFFDYRETATRLAGLPGLDKAVNDLLRRDAIFLLLIYLAALTVMRLLDAMQRQTMREETFLTSIGEGVILADADRKVTFMNPAGADIYHLAPGQAVGMHLADLSKGLTDLEGRPVPVENRTSSRAMAGQVSKAVYRVTRPDGTGFISMVTAAPVVFEARLIGTVFVFRDITKEIALERERAELLSIASHQLRTPLTGMHWIAEMLLRGDLGKLKAPQAEQVKAISDSTERMKELVNDMLNASRLESGKLAVEPLPTDLLMLARKTGEEIAPLVKEKRQEFDLRLPKKLPMLVIDGKLVRQAALNLLSNSVKYTPEGGHVRFSIEKRERDVLVTVKDDGLGIPLEQQKRVFEKFFRADNAVKSGAEGTGLGLYVVKQIVELSGGTLDFVSEPGKGTSFFFTLPLSGSTARAGTRTIA